MSNLREHLRARVAVYREHSEEARRKHEHAARSLRDDSLSAPARGALEVLAHVYDCEARRNLHWANSLELAASELDAG